MASRVLDVALGFFSSVYEHCTVWSSSGFADMSTPRKSVALYWCTPESFRQINCQNIYIYIRGNAYWWSTNQSAFD